MILSCVQTPVPVPQPSVNTYSIQLWIQDLDQQPLANPQIKISNPNQDPIQRSGDSQGRVTIAGLKKNIDYRLEISKPGYMSLQQFLRLPEAESPVYLRFSLNKRVSQISGRITDLQGRAVAGVLVVSNSDSNRYGLSNEQGNYQLDLSTDIGKTELKAHKQGYTSCLLSQSQSNCQLQPISLNKRVIVLLKGQVLNVSTSQLTTALTSLQKISQKLGFEFQLWQQFSNESRLDPDRDLLWIPAPAELLTTDEQETIESFVANGGKLLFSGEWAGFSHWNLQSSNELLKRFDWLILNDSIYQQQDDLSLEHFESHWLTKGLQSLKLYRSASIWPLSAQHQILASSAAANFQIQSAGGQGIWGHSVFGLGHVIVLGDSSLWLDNDSDGNGINNFHEANNAQAWENILAL